MARCGPRDARHRVVRGPQSFCGIDFPRAIAHTRREAEKGTRA
jgi:hypothetical protein